MHQFSSAAMQFSTLAIHAGEPGGQAAGSTISPIHMSNTFLVDPEVSFSAENLGPESPFIYSRWGNPVVQVLEQKVAALEGGEAAVAFSSGMAAVTGLLLHNVQQGGRVLVSDVAYAGVREFGNDLLHSLGIEAEPVNMSELDEVEAALQRPASLLFLETPCNPILRLTDIAAVSRLAHRYGARVAVDATFATPLATRPLELGADYVIHSLTKYFGGHGDAMGGIVVGSAAEMGALRQRVGIHLGAVLSPFNAWLINRGLATLPLRMRQHEANALQLARFLQDHPRVEAVVYPGLPSHPQHQLAKKQMACFSGMLTFRVAQPQPLIRRMQQHFQLFHYAVSLGHHKSLIFYIPTDELQQSSFRLPPENLRAYRRFAGEGIFRVSVGLEDADDLCRDLRRVLNPA